jgi:DNA-binding transcriptional ArsR family regulator
MSSKNIYEKGFIKLSKNILEWQWYTDSNVCRLFIHILLKANFKQNKWQGIEINVGEFVTSIEKLHIETGLSVQSVRTALNKLKESGYICLQPTNRFTLIKLNNTEVFTLEFNLGNNPTVKTITNNHQAINNQITLTNKEKKENNNKEKKELFQATLDKNKSNFSSDVLISFFNYWTEENKHTGRLRFEDEKFWNLDRRLSSWKTFNKTENKKTFTNNRNHG